MIRAALIVAAAVAAAVTSAQVAVARPAGRTAEVAEVSGTRQLTSTPAWGFPGKHVELRGAGLPASSRIVVTLDGVDVAVVRSDRHGAFTQVVSVPAVDPGVHHWRATAERNAQTTSARILIRSNWNTSMGSATRTGANPAETYLTVATSTQLETAWTNASLSTTLEGAGVYNGILYVGDNVQNGMADNLSHVYAVDAATGTFVWKSLATSGTVAPPVVVGNYVFVLKPNGVVQVLDRHTGRYVKFVVTQSSYTNELSPIVDLKRGMIYVVGFNGLTAVDAVTLKVRWFSPLRLGAVVSLDPDTGTLVAVDRDALHAVAADTGAEVWTVASPGTGNFAGSFFTTPIDHGLVYTPWRDGSLVAYRITDGTKVWSRAPEDKLGNTVPAIINGVLIAGYAGLQGLTGLDPATGKTLWANPDLPSCQSLVSCAPFGSPTVVYEGGGSVWVPIDPLTGRPTGGPSISIYDYGLPAVANGAIYYADNRTGALTAMTVPGIG